MGPESTCVAEQCWKSQSVYSLLAVPYNVLATKESVPTLCKLLKMRLRGFSNPPSAPDLLRRPPLAAIPAASRSEIPK